MNQNTAYTVIVCSSDNKRYFWASLAGWEMTPHRGPLCIPSVGEPATPWIPVQKDKQDTVPSTCRTWNKQSHQSRKERRGPRGREGINWAMSSPFRMSMSRKSRIQHGAAVNISTLHTWNVLGVVTAGASITKGKMMSVWERQYIHSPDYSNYFTMNTYLHRHKPHCISPICTLFTCHIVFNNIKKE